MYFHLRQCNLEFQLSFNATLNVITGDSATGKTKLIETIAKVPSSYVTDASAVYTNIQPEFIPVLGSNSIVFIDCENYEASALFEAICNCNRDDLYFVICGRKFLERLPLTVENTYKLKTVRGVTRNVPLFENSCLSKE